VREFEFPDPKEGVVADRRAHFKQDAFGPEDLQVLSGVFDHAWSSIAGEFNGNARSARTKLAQAIISLAQFGQKDTDCLKRYAVARAQRIVMAME
jgi:hypothetical protein